MLKAMANNVGAHHDSTSVLHKLKSICLLQSFLLHTNPFVLDLVYFLVISSLGFLSLKACNPRQMAPPPSNLDIFFTSVSAVTVSSMSTVDMEVFSSLQLVFMTILMLVGGEVFTSMIGLHFTWAKIARPGKERLVSMDPHDDAAHAGSNHHHPITIKLSMVSDHDMMFAKPEAAAEMIKSLTQDEPATALRNLKLKSIKTLLLLVSGYLLATHVAGSIAIAAYIALIPSASKVLQSKGLSFLIFPIFTTVSTFANCGFVPTNENMVAFKKNPGLLLISIPLVLAGNTLYPVCLRLLIRLAAKLMRNKKTELGFILENPGELGYDNHVMGQVQCVYLGVTVVGFIVMQLGVFCLMEWNNLEATGGLNWYQKLVGSVFQVVNSRHAGESVFDLSAISPAILVIFILMMYLPPYTSYLPIHDLGRDISSKTMTKNSKGFTRQHLLFSQLTYLTLFVILICITERRAMKTDPLNFNVLNIMFEVMSAYGNVGLSVGYHCGKQIKPDVQCKDAWYGFVGRWSNEGKFVLIVVMFFGRLKKFNKSGGRAWIQQ